MNAITPRLVPLLLALLIAPGCEFPRDAEGTLERVRAGGVLRVGVTARPPWVTHTNGRAGGIEAAMIGEFALGLGAKIEWIDGSESALAAALEDRRIDVLIGGHTRTTPWKRHAASTRPYLRARIVIAAPPGTVPPAEKSQIEDRTVAHRAGRPDIAARIATAGARPEPVQRFGETLAAIYEFESGRLGLTPTRIVLETEDHVMLAAPGESRFLLELDRFLGESGRRLALAADASP